MSEQETEWQPNIFIPLSVIPHLIPQNILPSRNCANCIFSQEDWKDDGFCYMFRIEPTGDKCGQFKSIK